MRQAAVRAIAAGWADDPGTLAWLRERATTDTDDDVRQTAAQAIARTVAGLPRTAVVTELGQVAAVPVPDFLVTGWGGRAGGHAAHVAADVRASDDPGGAGGVAYR
ncbi:HEAT repeat domain-containing protein [Actinoplanes sp. NEAU-A11]|uniref:HEAT repeat domain-containing protein n=1 Tax=Actinoplanes aureus TaxID=2792083 RepID=A0A931G5A9_9ACTN|nr:HEAT repeat domain-containing protein [Actinoplanes aureus]